MLEIIARVVFALLAVVGLTEICRLVVFWLLKSKRTGKIYYVVPMKNHEEDVELLLRSASQRLNWFPGGEEKTLVCLDEGMDEETAMLCHMMKRQLPCMAICTGEELSALFYR